MTIERWTEGEPESIRKLLEVPYKIYGGILPEGTKVLDCASGIGANQFHMKHCDITSVDYHDNEVGLNNYFKHDLNTPLDLFKDEEFDWAFSFETIEHLEPSVHINFVKELIRVSKAGVIVGTIAEDGCDFSSPKDLIFKARYGMNEHHLKEYSIEEWIKFAEYFRAFVRFSTTDFKIVYHADKNQILSNYMIIVK